MRTFNQFMTEQDDITGDIESNDVYQFKNKMAELINTFLQWKETEGADAGADTIKHTVLKLRSDMSFEHRRITSSKDLGSGAEQAEYNKQYNLTVAMLDQFEDPPSDIQGLLEQTTITLTNFHMFIQSKLQI